MSPAPDALLTPEAAARALRGQPFSRLIGARLATIAGGRATLEVDVRDELRQQQGVVHGGVLAYLADNALTFAGGSVLGPAVLTAGMTIDYVRPGRTGTLSARATVVHATARQTVCRCEVVEVAEDGTETVCAVAQGTIRSVRPPA
ncbi:PaaI family thioesterase [Patulibacter minatonensis]|uniref:PaaI family thioesterase n=1 Tax=Patulibacter minatonensis TaxID=298163 RepID=UPI00047E239B|nr:PaaI family thioesterase [Patulibacter minatonensis]